MTPAPKRFRDLPNGIRGVAALSAMAAIAGDQSKVNRGRFPNFGENKAKLGEPSPAVGTIQKAAIAAEPAPAPTVGNAADRKRSFQQRRKLLAKRSRK